LSGDWDFPHRPLVDTDDEVPVLQAIERKTSKRLSQRKINPDFQDWGSSCVEAAFAYRKEGGNRINDFHHGAWYAAFDEQTAISEVAFHKTRELGFIKDPARRYRDEKLYNGLQASFIGRFHDVREIDPRPDYMDADTDVGYPAGQTLANDRVDSFIRRRVIQAALALSPFRKLWFRTCVLALNES
jgi:hypothetical protein